MSETPVKVDVDQVVADFQASVQGALEQDKIDAAVERLRSGQPSYPANGTAVGMIFYYRLTVDIPASNKQFVGNAGGIGGLGGGGFWGDVYTDDLDRLFRTTVSFQFNATPVYLNVNFFDGSSNLLGNFQSGGIAVLVGTGGGSGGWS
ncbi:VapA/VapB family virulence-associated protein [Oerskovia turbata]